jgi:hypothetical protein
MFTVGFAPLKVKEYERKVFFRMVKFYKLEQFLNVS